MLEFYGIFYAVIPVVATIKNNEAIFHIINSAVISFNM